MPRISDFMRAVTVCVLTIFTCTLAPAGQKSSCAVLTFEAKAGMDLGQAGLLANRFAALLTKTGKYDVLSRYQTNRTLSVHKLDPAEYRTPADYAVASGRILNVQYVFFGRAKRRKQSFLLSTALLDVETGKIISTARFEYTGEMNDFIRAAPAENLKSLLGIKEIPAGVVRLPRPRKEVLPKVKPSEPKVKPPREVKPLPEVKPPPEVKVKPKVRPSKVKVEVPREIEVLTETEFELPAVEPRQFRKRLLEAVSDRFEIGTRFTHFFLLDKTKSDGFVGSISELHEDQNHLPVKLFAIYRFMPSFGVELAWNEVRARARNSWNNDSDGVFELEGPILSLSRRYPNQSVWTPRVGLGLAYFLGHFDHAGWWRNGYQNENDYRWLGPEPRHGKTRTMHVGNALGFVLYGGCDVQVRDHLYADVLLQYIDVTSDVSFSAAINGHEIYHSESWSVPFDHFSLGLGMKYVF